MGLLVGLPVTGAYEGRAKDITKIAEGMGLMLLIAGPGVIRFAPALIVTDAQLVEADRILRAAVTEFLAMATPAA
jgi:succinylornithine aminotransferase